MKRATLVRVLGVSVALGVLLSIATPAEAQQVTLGQVTGITRKLYPNGFRPLAQRPYAVNQADCIDGDVLNFPITLTGAYTNWIFQVWAGATDCTPIAERQTGGTSQCWLVYQGSFSGLTNGATSIPIFARNIASISVPSASTLPTTSSIPEADVSVCSGTGGAFQPLTLYFMLVDGTGLIQGSDATFTGYTGFDVTPPSAPSGIVLGAGENRIHVNWTPSTDTDVYGYNFYCDPPPGALTQGTDAGLLSLEPSLRTLAPALPGQDAGQGAGGAATLGSGGTAGAGGAGGADTLGSGGTAGAAGAGGILGSGGGAASLDAGITADAGLVALNCQVTSLTAGTVPNPKNYCGQTLGNPIGTGTGTANNLINGQQYAVAISAIDGVGNVGVLSANQCAIPVEITDFFELYRGYGGQGGGLCSIAGLAHRRASAWMIAALGAVVSLTTLRRKRRRS